MECHSKGKLFMVQSNEKYNNENIKKSLRSNFYSTNILVEFWYALPSYSCLVSSYSCLVPRTPVKFHLISKQYSGKNRSDQDKVLLHDA